MQRSTHDMRHALVWVVAGRRRPGGRWWRETRKILQIIQINFKYHFVPFSLTGVCAIRLIAREAQISKKNLET